MKLKSILHRLGFHVTPAPKINHQRPPLKALSHRSILMAALLTGATIGHRDASTILGTHNAPRRLNTLKAMMRRYGIRYEEKRQLVKGGRWIVLTSLPTDQREKARMLLGGAR